MSFDFGATGLGSAGRRPRPSGCRPARSPVPIRWPSGGPGSRTRHSHGDCIPSTRTCLPPAAIPGALATILGQVVRGGTDSQMFCLRTNTSVQGTPHATGSTLVHPWPLPNRRGGPPYGRRTSESRDNAAQGRAEADSPIHGSDSRGMPGSAGPVAKASMTSGRAHGERVFHESRTT